MTNFAFIMDLLKIPSKKFLEIGFDKSLVSRWRRGKLRLMPNRHIVKSISQLFWSVDFNSTSPILQDVLSIWYPGKPCDTEEEKQNLLERFLTEKGQFSEEYESEREKRLGKLITDKGENQFVLSKGIDSARLRILDFFDLVSHLPTPLNIEAAYPQGRGAVSFDVAFNSKFFEKYEEIFQKGHKMNAFVRSDDAISNFAYSYNNRLIYLLNGYLRNKYFDDFSTDTKELFLAAAGDSVALELKEEEPGRIETTVSAIYTDKENIEKIKKRIHKYGEYSKVRDYFNFFEKPNNYLKYVHISPDSPCYMFLRLPYFGIQNEENFKNIFSLSKSEKEFLDEEIKPFMLSPSFYWEYAPVRHIFCKSDIERELNKKRHQCTELSKLLNRRVWMTTSNLIEQLKEIKNLLNNNNNYEVCFLDGKYFDTLKVQLTVWGYGASIIWTDEEHSVASRGYVNQRIVQGFCHAVWSKIPEKMKARDLALRKIEKWLKKAQELGFDTDYR